MSNKKAGTSGRTKPTKRDFANMTMALKDEADTTKALYHKPSKKTIDKPLPKTST